jgi:hypothetical protein
MWGRRGPGPQTSSQPTLATSRRPLRVDRGREGEESDAEGQHREADPHPRPVHLYAVVSRPAAGSAPWMNAARVTRRSRPCSPPPRLRDSGAAVVRTVIDASFPGAWPTEPDDGEGIATDGPAWFGYPATPSGRGGNRRAGCRIRPGQVRAGQNTPGVPRGSERSPRRRGARDPSSFPGQVSAWPSSARYMKNGRRIARYSEATRLKTGQTT